jgi:hypothetical protein
MPPVPEPGAPVPHHAPMSATPVTPALTMLTVRITPDLLERAKIRAIKEKSTLQNLTAVALEAYLKTPLGQGRGR